MAAITDLSDLINRMSGGNSGTPETIFIYKAPRIAGVSAQAPQSGRMFSLWQYDSTYGGGAAPSAAAIPTNSTAGAIPLTNPGGSREKWLTQVWATSNLPGTILLYDRLMHIGGLSGTSTSDQTVQGASPSPALTRNTGGVGNIAFYEIYTAIGTTATTITMTYTNHAGTTGRTSTQSIGGSNNNYITRMQPIPLAAGDTGIQAIEKVKLTATTGTAGNFGITLGRPIAYIPIQTGAAAGWRDYTTGLPGLPKIDTNACLAWAYYPSATSVPEPIFALNFLEK